MGIFDAAFSNEGTGPGGVSRGLLDFIGFGSSGLTNATQRSSLTLSAFYNGIDQLSNDIAKLPKYVLKKDGENRNKYGDHPVNILISQRPSGLMNAFQMWKIVDISVKLKGNAFVEIIRNAQDGRVTHLVFRDFCDVQILEDETAHSLVYKYKGRLIAADDMLHFKGFTIDGKTGVGVVTYAAFSLGILLSSQTYGGEVYANKGLSFGVLQTEKVVSTEAKTKISSGFSTAMSAKNVHRAPVLDEGFQYKSISITPAEAQFLELNKHGITEVCRWLNIAPHKLKDLTNANYSNIYQQSIEHVQDSILPLVVNYEQELNNKLFSEAELGRVYTKFNITSLLRGDLDMKRQYYAAAINFGWMTRNEVRALEDMNPKDGLDEILQPLNTMTAEQFEETLNGKKKNE